MILFIEKPRRRAPKYALVSRPRATAGASPPSPPCPPYRTASYAFPPS